MPPLFSSVRISESDKWRIFRAPDLTLARCSLTFITFVTCVLRFQESAETSPGFSRDQDGDSLHYWLANPKTGCKLLRISERAVCSIRTPLTPWTKVHHRTENFPTSWPSRKYENSAAYELIRIARRPWRWMPRACSFTGLIRGCIPRPSRGTRRRGMPLIENERRNDAWGRTTVETGNERPASQNELIRPARSSSDMLCLVIDHRFCLKHVLRTCYTGSATSRTKGGSTVPRQDPERGV